MGRKGKRRKRPRAGDRAPQQRPDAVAASSDGEEPEAAEPQASPPRRGGLFSTLGIPSPHPPLGETIRLGAPPVADPRILGVAFLFVLALWALIVGVGSDVPPGLMAEFWAVPPISVFFDANVLSTVVTGAAASLAILIPVMAARAAGLTAIVRWIGDDLQDGVTERRGFLATSLSMFAIHAAEMGLVLIVYTLTGGFLGQQVGALLAWGLGLYFLGFVPAVVGIEGASAAEGLRRGLRAARLPGARHLTFVMLYLLIALWLSQFAPGGILPPATPSVGTWAYVLVATVLHLVAIGALTHRWIAVREEVAAGPSLRARRQGTG